MEAVAKLLQSNGSCIDVVTEIPKTINALNMPVGVQAIHDGLADVDFNYYSISSGKFKLVDYAVPTKVNWIRYISVIDTYSRKKFCVFSFSICIVK